MSALVANEAAERRKASQGRPFAADAAHVVQRRKDNGASIKGTTRQFGLSEAIGERY